MPALPGKVESRGQEADSLHRALVDAMNALHARRSESDALAEQVTAGPSRPSATSRRARSSGWKPRSRRWTGPRTTRRTTWTRRSSSSGRRRQRRSRSHGHACARGWSEPATTHARPRRGARRAGRWRRRRARAGGALGAAVDKMAAAVHDAQQAIAEGRGTGGPGAPRRAGRGAMERLAGEGPATGWPGRRRSWRSCARSRSAW